MVWGGVGLSLRPMQRSRVSRVRARDLTLRQGGVEKGGTEGKSAAAGGGAGGRGRGWYLWQYWGWLRPSAGALLGLVGLAVVAAGVDLVWPLLIKVMVDRLVEAELSGGEKLRWLLMCSAGVLVLLVGKQGIELLRAYRTAVLNAKLLVRLRRRLFGRLLGLPLARLGEFKSGGIVSRLGADVDQVGGLVQQALIGPGVAVLRIVLTMGVLVYLSWELAVATLVVLPVVGGLTVVWLRKVRPVYRSMMEERSAVDGRVGETFGGIRVVRSFRREPREAREYGVGTHTVVRKMLRANRVEYALENAWGLLIPLASLVVVGYGGYLVIEGRGQLGNVFAFQIYAVLLLGPVIQIVAAVSQTQKSLAAMERVFETLAEPLDKPDRPGALEAPGEVREIRLEGVGFAYREGVPVLEGVDLTVAGGQTVALVGPSGAGKTTLTDLICRFHDPTAGRILLNGVDLRDLKLASYRRLVAVVQQETFLFDGTVHENIAYGRRRASRAEVMEAARRANAHGFICELPEGYDTLIGERGMKLSGGQRQRLSIARAILADPAILVLDEATSNLDTESERLIQSAMEELLRGRTTFVIAHRLSTVRDADVMVVLEKGRVVEVGEPGALLERRGRYWEMVEGQRMGGGRVESWELGVGGREGGGERTQPLSGGPGAAGFGVGWEGGGSGSAVAGQAEGGEQGESGHGGGGEGDGDCAVAGAEVVPVDVVGDAAGGVVALEDDVVDGDGGGGDGGEGKVADEVGEGAVAVEGDGEGVPGVVGEAGGQAHVGKAGGEVPAAELGYAADAGELDDGVSGDGVGGIERGAPEACHAAAGGGPVGGDVEVDGQDGGGGGEVELAALGVVEGAGEAAGAEAGGVGGGDGVLEAVVAVEEGGLEPSGGVTVGVPDAGGLRGPGDDGRVEGEGEGHGGRGAHECGGEGDCGAKLSHFSPPTAGS